MNLPDDDDRYDAQVRDGTGRGDPAGIVRAEMTGDECAAWLSEFVHRMQPADVIEITVRRGYV